MLAVTGSTGRLGGRVAARLAAGGVPQRLVVRDPARAPVLPGAEPVVAASYDDGDGLRKALDGVSTLFLVSGREQADRVASHVSAVTAAVDAGVRRIVYVSFSGAAPDATFTFGRDHWHTEQAIRATGLAFTFLRDNLYLGMLPLFADAEGVIRGPAGDGRLAAVSHDDVADVAAHVLRSAAAGEVGLDGRALDLTGPEAITLHQAAEVLTDVLGRPFRYEPETVEEAYASRSGYGAPAFEVEGWVTSYTTIAAGDLERVSGDVQEILGRTPEDLRSWTERNRSSGGVA